MAKTIVWDDAPAKTIQWDDEPKKQEAGYKAGDTFGGALSNLAGAIVEAPLNMASAIGSKIVSDVAGLAATGYDMATGSDQAANFKRDIQEAGTYQPRTEGGKIFSEVNPIALIGKGIGAIGNAAGDAIGGGAAADTYRGAAGNLYREAIPQALGIAGASPTVRAAVGKGIEAITPKSIPLVGKLPETIRDIYRAKDNNPAGKELLAQEYLQNLLKDATPQEVAQIVSGLERRGRSVVPGSPVTSADAIARANRETVLAGKPERFGGQIVALEEGLAKVPETSKALTDVQLLREKARSDVLDKGAGTDKAYAAAELERKTASAPLYKQVEQSTKTVNAQPTVDLIDAFKAKRPGNKALVTAMDDVRSSLHEGDALRNSPGLLQSSIENINNLLAKQENASIRNPLTLIKKSLEHQINKVEKAQGLATKTYAEKSVPLNQMDLWRKMREKLIAPTGKEAPGSYLGALRDEQKLIKSATGYKRGSDISKIFDSEQSSLAAKLAAEMEMELTKKRMAGEVNLPGIGKPAEGIEPHLPNMLMRETMVANFLLKHLATDANVPVNIAAVRILKDPKMLASVIKQVKPQNRSGVFKAIKAAATSKTLLVGSPQMATTEEQQ